MVNEARQSVWEQARATLDGLPDGGLNIAWEALGRHAEGPAGERIALRCLPEHGPPREWRYRELAEQAQRFAAVLHQCGLQPGERVFAMLPPGPEVFVVALGSLHFGAVFCPLFAAFGPEPAAARLSAGEARLLVTTHALARGRLAGLAAQLPGLRRVLTCRGDPAGRDALEGLLEQAAAAPGPAPTGPETPALLHFTSGTTGQPKGALHVHEAVVAHLATARSVLGLQPGGIFWCTADPGWVTGTSYGLIAPLVVGATVLVDQAGFDPVRWVQRLDAGEADVWYTSPTALRMLRRHGVKRQQRDAGPRLLATVGEPLDAATARWSADQLGLAPRDTWWQTETGAIMLASRDDTPPGSMGRAVPGVEAAVMQPGADGRPVPAAGEAAGELALRTPWPSLFRAYLGQPDRYRQCFAGEWYLTGDRVRRDAQGWYWFLGRSDDVIKTAGHLVGPFEVEAALLSHPAVAEAGVVGRPDPVAGQVIRAHVILNPGWQPGDDLSRTLIAHARRRLGSALAPREVRFAERLPHTRSGKILRRALAEAAPDGGQQGNN